MRVFATVGILSVATTLVEHASSVNWYDGIDTVTVLSPGDSFDWSELYTSMRHAQFDDTRHAILMTSGNYPNAEIGVGYYTHVVGVGATRHDVVVNSFYSLDYNASVESSGGACNNFWRSVEGLTATNASLTWAASQACPIRRSVVQGDLALSEEGPGIHWSSGGFIGDVDVQGDLNCGTQQQFFFRNSRFGGNVSCHGLANGAFVGTVGEAEQSPHVSRIGATPVVAEKPFLVEDQGQWHIAVPEVKSSSSDIGDDTRAAQIPMEDVFVARAQLSADEINAGIQGKKALLLTPGVYDLEAAIDISQDAFVVLGIGFPTLVSRNGLAALHVAESASHVRVAMVLFEAGSPMSSATTDPMLSWQGSYGIGSDIFSRVGAFPGRGCAVTRADVHVEVSGDNTILDNTWMWHADHDVCSPVGADGLQHKLSDECYDEHGLQVDGQNVTVYGLKVEHQYGNLVQWNGEAGTVFFYQAELPYHVPTFGSDGFTGYFVNPSVTSHYGVALGVYIIYEEMTNVTAFRVPAGVDLENILAWCITGKATQFEHLACVGAACYPGDCSYNQCRLASLPSSLMV